MPVRFRINDLYWTIPGAIVTGTTIAADPSIEKALPTDPNTIKRFDHLSNYGVIAFGGLVGSAYLLGKIQHRDYLKDTAWLAGEAGANSFVSTYALKAALGRQRPTEENGQGDFFSGGRSFPSEHAAAAWSIATVFAERYPGPLTKLLAYGGASAISMSRLIGQKHFSSDVLVGSAIGWYFGRQAVRRHREQSEITADLGTPGNPKNRIAPGESQENPANMGSPFVPLDSWIYPALDRLSALNFIHTDFATLRPWTRMECARLLEEAEDAARAEDSTTEAARIFDRLQVEFAPEIDRLSGGRNIEARVESLYGRYMQISGTPVRDSYHFGQTIINDYGRPYWEGANVSLGGSGSANLGPLTFYVRSEYQHAPSVPAYSQDVRNAIAVMDENPVQPPVVVPTTDQARLIEAYAGFTFHDWQLSAGKESYWWGPGRGGALMLSDNAEPFYAIRINRVTPFRLPGIFRLIGPIRTDQFFGKLEGHQFPPRPFIYGQQISFKPTRNLEVAFSRTTVFAGQGITPLTFHTFFHSLFSFASQDKGTRDDPGDRRGGFGFKYKLPRLRNWLSIYADSLSDDDPSPLAAPRRAAVRTGFYLSHVPHAAKLDLRGEAVYTDVSAGRSVGGSFIYWEFIYHDSYLNKQNILGDWVGREGTGFQAWSTYWLRPDSSVQLSYRNARINTDFVPQGATLHDAAVQANLFVRRDLSVNARVQYEHLNIPLLSINQQSNLSASFGATFWPRWRVQ